MREIQEDADGETEGEDRMEIVNTVSATLAGNINRLYVEAEIAAEQAIGYSAAACRAAINCGKLLLEAKASNRGEFLTWLGIHCPLIQERTAQRYMKIAAKYPTLLSDASLDFQTLKDAYIACGIMPEPEGHEPSTTKPMSAWDRWTMRFDKIRGELTAGDREKVRAWLELQLSRL